MVEEIKKQIQFFNKVIILFLAVLVIMAIIIASNMINTIYNSSKVASLDNVIRETLVKYQPDRTAQQNSRETIQESNLLLHQLNETINGVDKNLTTK